MNNPFPGVQTLIFCDETKFSIENGDKENATYYFGVCVEKAHVPTVNNEVKDVLQRHKVKTEVFHATKIFREKRPRPYLMEDLNNVIIKNRLRCFCHKYSKTDLFETTKLMSKFNNDILDFNNPEYQALFYFLSILNLYLRDIKPHLVKKGIAMFFDRNVYGIDETESFKFPDEYYEIKQMTFTEKSKISLLCLPDFFGYIFRKSKISQNKAAFGDNTLETSVLTINAYKNLLNISAEHLFDFIETDLEKIEQALKYLIK